MPFGLGSGVASEPIPDLIGDQSGLLQIRYYVPRIFRASTFLGRREYQVAIWLFAESTETDSDLLLVFPSRAATLSLTVSRGIMEVTQGKG
jgi:hypothetical protein